MRVDEPRFQKASDYAFNKVYPSYHKPAVLLSDMFNSSDDWLSKKSYVLSMTHNILLGLKSISKFHRYMFDTRDDLNDYIDLYFPRSEHWNFKRLYMDYEQGTLVHHLSSCDEEDSECLMEAFGIHPFKLLHCFDDSVDQFHRALIRPESSEYRTRFYHNYTKLKRVVSSNPIKH